MCMGKEIKEEANERDKGPKMASTPSFRRLEAKEDVVCGAKRVGKGEEVGRTKHGVGGGEGGRGGREKEGKGRKGRREGDGGQQVLYAGKEDLNSWLPGSDLRGSWQQHVTPCLSVHASLQILFISSDGGRGK
ncbi:hypothetical protein Purlil1_9400 [Purpureocillium lilacinum]|uniref:Uncharacterized protein n=1 Tax=Purpureocillium lilacinum TaxID=33203 RepID=A0ABR0BQK3_PURLI|nr:hypothetical protein Purlil1_9400 [Purpureocillium lilacinum]